MIQWELFIKIHVSLNIFLSYRKNFLGTQKRLRISHGKRAIGVRVKEVLLYVNDESYDFMKYNSQGKIKKIQAVYRVYLIPSVCVWVGGGGWGGVLFIRKTCIYNFDPLKPHFYIVELGFTGYIFSILFLLKNIDCGYPLDPPR